MIKEKPVLFVNKSDCSACCACYNVCPKDAIQMIEDECGYYYPNIDAQKCIGCNRCKNVCAFQNTEEVNVPLITYVAVAKNKTVLSKSASGGVFGALGEAVIKEGGCVYGAAYDTDFSVKHIFADTEAELEKIQGSKYTQSYIGTAFREVKKKLLESDRFVIFSGCPCQIAGLKAYLGKNYGNLLTIDLICHGVPSNKMFKEYIKAFEKRENVTVNAFTFRDKHLGWGHNSSAQVVGNKSIPVSQTKTNSYISYFMDGSICRENCNKCKYANSHRAGDITIGDYWGIEKEHPELVDSGAIETKNGVSVLIVNTEKGHNFLKKHAECFDLFESEYEKAAVINTQLTRPTPYNANKRARVLKIYKKRGWIAVEKDYQRKHLIIRAKRKAKRIIKTVLPQKMLQLLKRGEK